MMYGDSHSLNALFSACQIVPVQLKRIAEMSILRNVL